MRRDEEAIVYTDVGERTPYVSYYSKFHATACMATHLAGLLLYRQLADIVETVDPDPGNGSTFGHSLRQLLIGACTEVEAAWRAVLVANQYNIGSRYSTNDYVRLLPAMRLDEWSVRLAHHERWQEMSPFVGWSNANPTQTLPWYEDYNAVKHDREGALHMATLSNVLQAMAAVAIMGWAQFGERIVGIESLPLSTLFVPTKRPRWQAIDTYYGPESDDSPDWRVVPITL